MVQIGQVFDTNCWVRKEIVDSLSSVTISNGHGLNQHIMLCTERYSIMHFIATARTCHLHPSEIRPILVLCPEPPTSEEFASLSIFPNLYFMTGNPHDISILKKANILQAHKIVLLNLSNQDPDLADSPTM